MMTAASLGDDMSVDSSLATPSEIHTNIPYRPSRYNYVSIFFRCMSCCNCILVIALTGFVAYEGWKIQELEEDVQNDQETIAALQEEVREKQENAIQELHQEVKSEHNLTLLTLAGIFTLLTCLISMFHMSSHLQKMNQPIIQRKIVAILWMSPIYSVTSFLSLLYPPLEGYMAIIKDFYESYCIYIFLSFLIVVLGRGSRDNAVEVLAMHAHHLERPTRCLSRWYNPPPDTSDWAKAHAVLTECQIFAMQFVFIRPLTTVIYVIYRAIKESNEVSAAMDLDMDPTAAPIMTEAANETGTRLLKFLKDVTSNETEAAISTSFPSAAPLADVTTGPTAAPIDNIMFTLAPSFDGTEGDAGDFTQATKAYFKSFGFFLAMVVNVSVFFAFTGLLKFYHSVHKDLEWCRPWPKFLTIKGVVFLTFWQGLAILIFVNLDSTISDDPSDNPTARAHKYQNVLICCEMLLFSLTHWCVFPAEEWEKDYQPPTQVNHAGLGIKDFVSDVNQIYRNGRRRRKSRRRRHHTVGGRRGRGHEGGMYHRPARIAEEEEEDYYDDKGVDADNFNDKDFPSLRARLSSDGSSVKADDEDDENELL